jgi:3-keto-L-gulonate-6-phosphate decarboxylase
LITKRKVLDELDSIDEMGTTLINAMGPRNVEVLKARVARIRAFVEAGKKSCPDPVDTVRTGD